MLAAVVVGDFGQTIEDGGYGVETLLGHRQRSQGEGAAQAVDVEHGAETGQGAIVQQRLDPRTQGVWIAIQFVGQRLPGPLYQRQAMLQAVDQSAVKVIHGPAPGQRVEHSGRRTV